MGVVRFQSVKGKDTASLSEYYKTKGRLVGRWKMWALQRTIETKAKQPVCRLTNYHTIKFVRFNDHGYVMFENKILHVY